jgi:hypothetical protein
LEECVARYKVIKVGKPIDIAELRRAKQPRERKVNPRDQDLRLLINEVSAGSESQVWPWELGNQKPATARAAANRLIKQTGSNVYVGVHHDHPGKLLFSRQPLRARRSRSS